MSTTAEKFPLEEVAEGRIDQSMFLEFLQAYGYYWHNCHTKGRINEGDLYDAERNAIKYAKDNGMKLEFGEMTYHLTDSACEWPDDTSTEAEQAFLLTVGHLQNDIDVWDTVRRERPDEKSIQEFRLLFIRQIARLEKMAKRGIVTPRSTELVRRAQSYLSEM